MSKPFSGGEKATFYPKLGWNVPLGHPCRGSEEFFTSYYWLVVSTNPVYTLLDSDVASKPHLGTFHQYRVKTFIWGQHTPLLTCMTCRMLYRTCMGPKY